MKKILFLSLVVMLFTTACTTKEFVDITTHNRYVTVKSNQWKIGSDDTGNYFYYTIDEPKLTNYVLENASLNTYLYYVPKGLDSDVLSPLPFSDFIVDDQGYKWEEHITVEYEPEYVTFLIKPDDHKTEDTPRTFYNEYTFCVRFLW
ncbi:MAG: hypothetical protein LBN93_01845 [Candidatus Symbiothrix sp.]|jgi:hypothetical protein|nr:hypothetical protein [Candidatus Symbiothrix sp.]